MSNLVTLNSYAETTLDRKIGNIEPDTGKSMFGLQTGK